MVSANATDAERDKTEQIRANFFTSFPPELPANVQTDVWGPLQQHFDFADVPTHCIHAAKPIHAKSVTYEARGTYVCKPLRTRSKSIPFSCICSVVKVIILLTQNPSTSDRQPPIQLHRS